MREFPNATPRPRYKRKTPTTSLKPLICGPAVSTGEATVTVGWSGHGNDRTADDNAALIVHAVNTYESRERLLEEAQNVVSELVDLMNAVRDGDYQPDSFTCQPARTFLAKMETRDA